MQKRWILAVFAALVLTLAFAGTAMAAPPGTVISNELGGEIEVQEAGSGVLTATWVATGRYGTNLGTVYKEFELMYNGQQVPLAQDAVKSITVLEPGAAEPRQLTPDTDDTLWFNVAKKSGEYVFTVVTADDTTYEATLQWTKMNILKIGWDLPGSKTVNKDEAFQVVSTAELDETLESAGVTEVGRVLYVIEVTKNGTAVGTSDVTVVASDGQELSYDSTGKFFYWGPRTGFTFSTDMYKDGKVTTTFNVTFRNAGTYDVKAYAVQLPRA